MLKLTLKLYGTLQVRRTITCYIGTYGCIVDCVRADRKEKTDPWRWENIKKKCALRKEYIEIYKKKKMKKKLDQEQKKRIEELEKVLTYEDIAL